MLFTIFAYIIVGSLLLGFVALLVFYVLYVIEVSTDKKFVIQEEVSKPAPEVDSRAIDAYFGDTSPHDTPVPKPKKSIRLVPKTEADTAPNDLWLWYAATHD